MSEFADAAGISPRTVRKLLQRVKTEGEFGLMDRSSQPHKARLTMNEKRKTRIDCVSCSMATISRMLATLGLSSLKIRTGSADRSLRVLCAG